MYWIEGHGPGDAERQIQNILALYQKHPTPTLASLPKSVAHLWPSSRLELGPPRHMYLCCRFSSPEIGDCFVSVCTEPVSGTPIILVITRTRSVPLCVCFVLFYCLVLDFFWGNI